MSDLQVLFALEELENAFGVSVNYFDPFDDLLSDYITEAFLLHVPNSNKFVHITLVSQLHISGCFENQNVIDELSKITKNEWLAINAIGLFEECDGGIIDFEKPAMVHVWGDSRNFLYLVPLKEVLDNVTQFL